MPRKLAAFVVAAFALLAAVAHAQDDWQWRGWFGAAPRLATPESFDGAFNFCRVMYGGYGGRSRWATDYPSADINLSIRLGELTKTPVSRDNTGAPNHLVVPLADEALFLCPFVLMAQVESLYFDPEDARRLRTYLLKGGFLWVDDFWGSDGWASWASEIAKVLPPGEYPIVDLTRDHALYRTMFELSRIPQIPSINFWRWTGGGTSERGADSAEVHVRGIADPAGRLMVLMTHNTDISDSWEREGEDPDYFYQFSVEGYAAAVNVLLYTMTH